MAAVATQAGDSPAGSTGSTTGEEILFWILAPLAVLGAAGLVFARKAVHGALFLAVTMVSLAFLYIALEAPFLGVVQMVVYTGAVMMLFLFVIMLVGVDASDSRVETIRGQRVGAGLALLGVIILLMTVAGRAALPDPVGTAQAAPDGNVYAIADLLFGRYVWVFEVVAAVLITAAVGAMVLTHRERTSRRLTQREMSEKRFRDADPQQAAGQPPPGVYARHNAVDTPALLPDGTPAETSISPVLIARGAARSADEFTIDLRQLGDEEGSDAAPTEPSDDSTSGMSGEATPGAAEGNDGEAGTTDGGEAR
ncbi:NADH-quinone oxidoreductase subunit J [Actinobacteria bacterium YIM 96077]|uniref:NADH-quinone oxidoreductase subunit J n=1 Tax=Phytoactinopolyspora halophila TaxID=1981511 RepID=A0A329QLC1_9ACTN|nr:NADH-quinone oxidoreductase subunit J [Actinobacteria bacterium YIM 96077]RAW13144.1 NADH-quinone oxidoreductase subunit J [Phytoactinopolyspora halophila]